MERPVGFEPTMLLTQESFADSPLRPSRARTLRMAEAERFELSKAF
jgi:hypothetical protein